MTDRPMDAFELRLARDLRELSAPAVGAVDARALTAALAAGQMANPMVLHRPRRIGRVVLVLVAAALALSAAVLLFASAHPPAPRLPKVHLGHLAFERDGEIWVVNPDGTGAEQVTNAKDRGRAAMDPHWHGTTLTFLEMSDGGSGPLTIAVLDRPGSVPREVEVSPSWPDFWPVGRVVVSPDGTQYAFLDQDALVIGSLDGGAISVPPPAGYDAWDTSDLESLAWHPDARSVLAGTCQVLASCQKSSGGTHGRHDLFSVSTDGTSITKLTSGDNTAWGAHYSLDGSQIAYQTCNGIPPNVGPDDCDSRGYYLGVMASDGSHRRVIDETTASEGWGSGITSVWSPDGTRLAYLFSGHTGTDDMFLADADGATPPRAIGRDGYPLTWTPDGTVILVTGSDIRAVSGDGSSRLLLHIPEDQGWALGDWEWVPDGTIDPFDAPGG